MGWLKLTAFLRDVQYRGRHVQQVFLNPAGPDALVIEQLPLCSARMGPQQGMGIPENTEV